MLEKLKKKGGFCGVFREEEEEKFSASKEDAFLFLSQTKEQGEEVCNKDLAPSLL